MTNRRPVFDQFNLVVSDMEASVTFYRLLGLEIPDTLPQWQHQHRTATLGGGVDLDVDSVVSARNWNTGWPGGAGGHTGVLGLRFGSRQEVDEIHSVMIDAGYRSQQSPYDAFWGARYAVIEDPDGNAVGLMSPADPAHRFDPENLIAGPV